jgi:hypothetical protein
MEEGQTPTDLKREQSEPGVAQNGLDVAAKDGALEGDTATPLDQGEMRNVRHCKNTKVTHLHSAHLTTR